MELLKAGPQNFINQFHFRGGLGHQEQMTYDIGAIMKSLHVAFRRKVYTTSECWQMMTGMINQADEMMGEIRINCPQENVGYRAKDKEVLIVKYRVYLFDRQWTYAFYK